MLDTDGDVIMLRVSPFTIVSGGANGVDWKAEALAKQHQLDVKVLVPPCHPGSKTIRPLSHLQLHEANPWIHQAEQTLNISNAIFAWYVMWIWCLLLHTLNHVELFLVYPFSPLVWAEQDGLWNLQRCFANLCTCTLWI